MTTTDTTKKPASARSRRSDARRAQEQADQAIATAAAEADAARKDAATKPTATDEVPTVPLPTEPVTDQVASDEQDPVVPRQEVAETIQRSEAKLTPLLPIQDPEGDLARAELNGLIAKAIKEHDSLVELYQNKKPIRMSDLTGLFEAHQAFSMFYTDNKVLELRKEIEPEIVGVKDRLSTVETDVETLKVDQGHLFPAGRLVIAIVIAALVSWILIAYRLPLGIHWWGGLLGGIGVGLVFFGFSILTTRSKAATTPVSDAPTNKAVGTSGGH